MEQVHKRGAIVGTAPTWKLTPWDDQTLDVFSLNDAYVLKGFGRATAWFDLHALPEMIFRPRKERVVKPADAPVGGYLRPEGHLEWLKSRPFPVYLHSCAEAKCAENPQCGHTPYPFPKWDNARPFPFQAVTAAYGSYFSSTPAWILAWMMAEGYTETHIYGVHLATEWEYIHQKPNMEFLIGVALGKGVQFTIPEKSTLLKGKHQYALEPKPELGLEHVQRKIERIKGEGAQLQASLSRMRWRLGRAKDIRERLEVLDLELADAKMEYGHIQAMGQVS